MRKNNFLNTNIKSGHSRTLLSGIFDARRYQIGKTLLHKRPLRGRSPITTLGDDGLYVYERQTTHGFTLIELLVVVLIIGILAAVAIPQYQLAVVKARVSAYFPLMKNIVDAETAYYLANGGPSLDVSKLDIDMPADCTLIDGNSKRVFACGKDVMLDNSSYELVLSYCPGYNTTPSSCWDHRDFLIEFYNNGYKNNGKECIVKNNSALGTKICKLLTF